MANKPIKPVALVAAKWWVAVMKNGLKHKNQHPLLFLQQLANKGTPYPQKTYDRFEKQLATKLSQGLDEFSLISLYTKTKPEGLLATCAKNSVILYQFNNPFPQHVTMQVTPQKVVVKSANFYEVLYDQNELEK
jgi:hypothetical protein